MLLLLWCLVRLHTDTISSAGAVKWRPPTITRVSLLGFGTWRARGCGGGETHTRPARATQPNVTRRAAPPLAPRRRRRADSGSDP